MSASKDDGRADILSSAQSTGQRKALWGRSAANEAGQADVHTRIVDLESERDRHTRVVELEIPAIVKRAVRQKERAAADGREKAQQGEGSELSLLEQLQERLELLFVRMHRLDRWTWWALIGVAVSAFLPWHAVDGVQLEAGIEGFGLVSVVAAAVALGCIQGRTTRRRLARRLMLLQFAAMALVFVPPVRLALTSDPKYLSFGVMLTTALGLLATAFGVLRLLRFRD